MKAKERHHILATTDPNFKKHRAEIAKKYYHHKKEKLMTLLKEQQENNEPFHLQAVEQKIRGRHKIDKYKGLFNKVIKELTNISSKRKLCMLLFFDIILALIFEYYFLYSKCRMLISIFLPCCHYFIYIYDVNFIIIKKFFAIGSII
jgi:hypothetical protein